MEPGKSLHVFSADLKLIRIIKMDVLKIVPIYASSLLERSFYSLEIPI